MRQKVLFGQIEILFVLGIGCILGGFFLCGGIFYHQAAGIWKGTQKEAGRRISIPMYIRISISDSFITGVSLSTLYVQVHDCQLKNSITDPTHPSVLLNPHLRAWATWRRDLSPKPQSIFLESGLKKRRR